MFFDYHKCLIGIINLIVGAQNTKYRGTTALPRTATAPAGEGQKKTLNGEKDEMERPKAKRKR